MSSEAISTLRLSRWVMRRASFAVVVVLPEPCRPTIMIATGGTALRSMVWPSEPSMATSSSWTILTTIWPGVTDLTTVAPTACSRTRSVKLLTTSSETSASSSARRTSRIAASTSASVSEPRPVSRSSIPPSFSDRLSNNAVVLCPVSGRFSKHFRARGRIALSGVGLRSQGPGGGSKRTSFREVRGLNPCSRRKSRKLGRNALGLFEQAIGTTYLFSSANLKGVAKGVNCTAGSMLARRTPYNASCAPPCPPIRDPAVPITRRRVFGMLAGAAVAVGVPSVWMSRMKTYDGPVSDHFDGLQFFDPDGVPPRSLGQVLRWQLGSGRERANWPDWVPSPYADTPPPRVDGGKVRLSYVGHASWLIQTAGLNILIDPVWSMRASPFTWAGPKRHNDPGIAFEALPKIDVVLVSHGHYDHLDLATLSKLAANFSPRVITPLGNDVTMRDADGGIKAEAFDWQGRTALGNGVAVTLVPTRHWSARGLFDRNKALWASFVLETPAGKLYIVCDSGYGEGKHFRRVAEKYGPLRLAILPIGAYEPRWFMKDQHMNPSDAVKALADCGAEQALAHHHGTFQLTDEAIDAPVMALDEALKEAKIPPERFAALKPGQVVEI